MKSVTIYHNNRCSTSRKTLELLRERGIEPVVIAYLDNPPTKEELKRILKSAGLSVRQIMRAKEVLYKELNLADESLSEEQLLDVIMIYPILLERPIVVTDKGARLGRPVESVLEIL